MTRRDKVRKEKRNAGIYRFLFLLIILIVFGKELSGLKSNQDFEKQNEKQDNDILMTEDAIAREKKNNKEQTEPQGSFVDHESRETFEPRENLEFGEDLESSKDLESKTVQEAIRWHITPYESCGTISSLALSPNGKFLAVGHTHHAITIWKVRADKTLTLYASQEPSDTPFPPFGSRLGALQSLTYSSPSMLISASGTGCFRRAGYVTVELWNFCQKRKELNFVASLPEVGCSQPTCALAPDRLHLATVDHGKINLFSRVSPESFSWGNNGKPYQQIEHYNKMIAMYDGLRRPYDAGIMKLLFTPDGSTLISASSDGTIIIWKKIVFDSLQPLEQKYRKPRYTWKKEDFDSFRQAEQEYRKPLYRKVKTIAAHFGRDITAMALSPDGRYLVTGDDAGALRIMLYDDILSYNGLYEMQSTSYRSEDFSAFNAAQGDEEKLYACKDGKRIFFHYQAEDCQTGRSFTTAHKEISLITFSADGTLLAIGTRSGFCALINVAGLVVALKNKTMVDVLCSAEFDRPVSSGLFLPDNRFVFGYKKKLMVLSNELILPR